MKEGKQPLRKTSRGKGIMVSAFITLGGRLKAPDWISAGDLPGFGLTPESD